MNEQEMSGVISVGLKAPIIREGDDLVQIVVQTILDYTRCYDECLGEDVFLFGNKDVIGITESVVARAQGNYVTVDDIAQFLNERAYAKKIVLAYPIMSRNRFSLILKGFARYCDEIAILEPDMFDEQGNPTHGINQFTGVDIEKYYQEICEQENCKFNFILAKNISKYDLTDYDWIDCKCHPDVENYVKLGIIGLCHIMSAPVTRPDGTVSGYNEEYGLLGSNKADEERLKLFPRTKDAQKFVEDVQSLIQQVANHPVEVMIFGDGCFKDPVGGIWEFADPVTSPAYTPGLEGSPNEIKVKYIADSKYKHLSGEELERAISKEIDANEGKNLVGNMSSEGTTPRRYVDLLASLMDLTTGSGSRCTPIVLVQNYFD